MEAWQITAKWGQCLLKQSICLSDQYVDCEIVNKDDLRQELFVHCSFGHCPPMVMVFWLSQRSNTKSMIWFLSGPQKNICIMAQLFETNGEWIWWSEFLKMSLHSLHSEYYKEGKIIHFNILLVFVLLQENQPSYSQHECSCVSNESRTDSSVVILLHTCWGPEMYN